MVTLGQGLLLRSRRESQKVPESPPRLHLPHQHLLFHSCPALPCFPGLVGQAVPQALLTGRVLLGLAGQLFTRRSWLQAQVRPPHVRARAPGSGLGWALQLHASL